MVKVEYRDARALALSPCAAAAAASLPSSPPSPHLTASAPSARRTSASLQAAMRLAPRGAQCRREIGARRAASEPPLVQCPGAAPPRTERGVTMHSSHPNECSTSRPSVSRGAARQTRSGRSAACSRLSSSFKCTNSPVSAVRWLPASHRHAAGGPRRSNGQNTRRSRRQLQPETPRSHMWDRRTCETPHISITSQWVVPSAQRTPCHWTPCHP